MLRILHRDEHLIAIDKPSGLLVHRSELDRHETRFALQLLRDQIGRRVFPVHRLDKATSGILVFALDPGSAASLGAAFETRLVSKRYLAVVRGHPPARGTIDHALSRRYDAPAANHAVTSGLHQHAVTHFTRIATAELPHRVDRYPSSRYALLALSPQTGRRHQLRRHMKHVSHPIIGDTTYGKGRHNRLFADLFGVDRLLLACTRLCLAHPHTGTTLELGCAPAPEFMRVIEALGWAPAVQSLLASPPAKPVTPDGKEHSSALSIDGDS